MAALTAKQSQFVKEYLIDLNATQAAIRAGYSKRTAFSIGVENLNKPLIADAIQKAMDARSQRTEVTQDMVISELAKIAFLDIRDAFDDDGNLLNIKEMPEAVARAVAGLDISQIGNKKDALIFNKKLKLSDKKGALELLGRHLKMFTDKKELTGADGKDLFANVLSEALQSDN